MAHSPRYGETWLPVTHDAVTRIAYDTSAFSNCGPLVGTFPPQNPPGSLGLTPLTSDPPFHAMIRRPLLSYFAPNHVDGFEAEIREICVGLLDDIGASNHIDAAQQYAQHVPTMVTARMLGFPDDDAAMIREWVKRGFEGVNHPLEAQIAHQMEKEGYLDGVIEDHLSEPRDDLTSYLIAAEMDGAPFDRDRVRTNMHLLLVAGVDTTWSAIGSSS